VITSRRGILAASARARHGGGTYTLWPDARQPMISADMGYPPAAEWLRATMVPTLRRLPDAAAWMALRAGAALVAEQPGLAADVAQRVLGRSSPVRIAMYSPSGQAVSKVICFMFAEGDAAPRLVVKGMAEPRFSDRLRTESAVLESVRARVAHDAYVVAALPPAPLLAHDVAPDFVLAEPFDALGEATGSGGRTQAHEWLEAFQAASCTRTEPWGVHDDRWAVGSTRDAWSLARRPAEEVVVERVRALVAPLRGAPMPRCAIHGDFWHGNVAARKGSVRVYDWEWAVLDGIPLVDLWTYELANLRIHARDGGGMLDDSLRDALRHVRAGLRRRALDERLALATLAPILGELSFRVRRRLRMPDEMERASITVMAAAERLLLST
jgi:hypothetical protein